LETQVSPLEEGGYDAEPGPAKRPDPVL